MTRNKEGLKIAMMMMLTVQTGRLLEVLSPHPPGCIQNTSNQKQVFENITAKIWRILDTSVTAVFSPLFPEVGFRDSRGLGSEFVLPLLKHPMVYKENISEHRELSSGFER